MREVKEHSDHYSLKELPKFLDELLRRRNVIRITITKAEAPFYKVTWYTV